MNIQKQSLTRTFDKVQGIPWVRAFLSNNEELSVTWLAPDGIGFKRAPEDSFTVSLVITIEGCSNPKPWGLKIDVSFAGDDEFGKTFHMGNGAGEFNIWYLVWVSRISNQSEKLSIQHILADKGLVEWTEEMKKKSFSFSLGNSLGNVLGLSVAIVALFTFWITIDRSALGVVASYAHIESVAVKNGLTIERLVSRGENVKKGQILARLVNPKNLGDIILLRDQVAAAKKERLSIQNEIATKTITLKSQHALVKTAERVNSAFSGLAKQGFMSELGVSPKEKELIQERNTAELITEQIRELKLRLELLNTTWGLNFSKADLQMKALEKQQKGLQIVSKCNCFVLDVDPRAEFTDFKLVDRDRPYFIEVAVEREKAVDLKNGQILYFRLPGSTEYNKGKYSAENININNRIGFNSDIFYNSKYNLIRVIPDEPVRGGMEMIGKPVSVLLKWNVLSPLFYGVKRLFQGVS